MMQIEEDKSTNRCVEVFTTLGHVDASVTWIGAHQDMSLVYITEGRREKDSGNV
jgi:hypothetical protein